MPSATSSGWSTKSGGIRSPPASLHHTLHLETSVRWRAEVQVLDSDPLILMWATPTDGNGPEAVEDILRAETADGGITRLRWYPDVLAEVSDQLGVPHRTHRHIL